MQRESGRRGSQRRPRAPAALDLARARSHNRADRCSDPTTPQLGNSAAARPARSIAAAIASAAFADALAPVSHVGLIDAAALARSLVARIAIVRPLGHEHTHARSQSVSDGGRPTLAHAHTRTRSIERRAADASRPRSLGSQPRLPRLVAVAAALLALTRSLIGSAARTATRIPPSSGGPLGGANHAGEWDELSAGHPSSASWCSSTPRGPRQPHTLQHFLVAPPSHCPRHRHDDDHPSERQTHRVAARSQADGSRLERSVRSSRRGLRCVDSRAQHTHTQREPRVSEQAATLAHTARERERAREVGGQRERARWRGAASQPLSIGPQQQSIGRESSD